MKPVHLTLKNVDVRASLRQKKNDVAADSCAPRGAVHRAGVHGHAVPLVGGDQARRHQSQRFRGGAN